MQFLILEKCQSSWNPCHSPHHSLMQKWAIKSSTKPPKCWFWHHRNTPGFFLHVIWLSLKASELEAPEICSRWVWLLNLRLQRFAVDGFLWSIGGDIVYKLNSFWNAYSLLFRGINCNCKLTLHQMSTVAAAAAKSLHSYLTLCDLMDCGLPGSSIHGILQARILEWVAVPSSRGSSWRRDWTRPHVSWIAGRFFTTSATWEAFLYTNKELSQRKCKNKSLLQSHKGKKPSE